ncbi:MAG TPA: glycosyltransferase family 2 protein [Candidatus Polarisedimenticolia bacterium]|jgi:dolichol-phosphate mannosyltransferase|nr:glycosyltransferase family 2 protein [Candidatus Polarisedimenticolia bacterium]
MNPPRRLASHLSVVVPFYNEEENVAELYRRLSETLNGRGIPYVFYFINDGSRDGTLDRLRALAASDRRVRVLSFSRNFGHQISISAGLAHADGDASVVMDSDLQDPPEVVPDLLARWSEGYDVVCAVRRQRKEGPLKRAAYAIFYRLLRRISNIDIPLDSGDFSLLDARVVGHLRSLPERNRFVRGLRSWVGFRRTEIEYERMERRSGEPKYRIRHLMKLALDGFFAFSTVPLQVSTWIGFMAAGLGFLYLLFAFISHLLYQTPAGWTSLAAIVLFLGGTQLILLGILGEYVGRIYEEVKQRPLYIVEEAIGFPHEAPQPVSHTTETRS